MSSAPSEMAWPSSFPSETFIVPLAYLTTVADQYNAEDYEIVVNQNGRDVRIGVFDKVTVVIEVDRVRRQVN
jgi:hypothetical protein